MVASDCGGGWIHVPGNHCSFCNSSAMEDGMELDFNEHNNQSTEPVSQHKIRAYMCLSSVMR